MSLCVLWNAHSTQCSVKRIPWADKLVYLIFLPCCRVMRMHIKGSVGDGSSSVVKCILSTCRALNSFFSKEEEEKVWGVLSKGICLKLGITLYFSNVFYNNHPCLSRNIPSRGIQAGIWKLNFVLEEEGNDLWFAKHKTLIFGDLCKKL